MAIDETFLKFQWQDRCGLVWTVGFTDEAVGFYGFMVSRQVCGTGLVLVKTPNIHSQKHSMSLLDDVRVDSHIENRGLGSMLARKAIEECIRRGHKGIYGYLSDADICHFPKLKYFYEKLGFSVVFYEPEHPDYRPPIVGKVELIF